MEVVHSRYGQLIASRNDIYVGRGLFEYGEFSEGEVEFFRQVVKPTDIVCDVGANIGAHTLAFARLARHVYAYEPIPMLYLALCGMVALNELRNVTTIHAGCAGREGTMSYADVDFSKVNNFGANSLQRYSGQSPIRITRLTTDCQFLKVDVEGMELEVLKGATDMIRRCRPILYIEADRKEKFEPLVEYIRQLGYHPYWHTPPLYNPHNFAGNSKNNWGDAASFNLICSTEQSDRWPQATEFPKNFRHQRWEELRV